MRGQRTSGHVMIVLAKPQQKGNNFLVRVTDSAPSGHSKDTRLPKQSGIGIGTLLLRTKTTTLQPTGYAWKVGSPLKSQVRIVMARPNDLS